ncbi:MAG: phosphotransferase [Magnetospirillum sp.]|nr:phosphotransferase [Magnetospirillum sp.]
MSRPDLVALHRALTALPAFAELAPAELVPLPAKGLSHGHVRVKSRRVLLRIPRARAEAGAALAREAEMFKRAQPSDATPRLHGVLAVSAELPGGALIVDEIPGANPKLPAGIPALGATLAAIHKLEPPAEAARAPLETPADPVRDVVATIEANFALLDKAGLDPKAKIALGQELAWAKEFASANEKRLAAFARRLCVVDTHPGNFVVAPGGRAYFVDIEKCVYSLPGLDLAHAVTRPALAWDADCATTLGPADIDAYIRAWSTKVGDALTRETLAAMRPFRRLVWLRTTSQFVRFRVEGTHKALDGRYADHAEKAIAAALDLATIADQRKAWG